MDDFKNGTPAEQWRKLADYLAQRDPTDPPRSVDCRLAADGLRMLAGRLEAIKEAEGHAITHGNFRFSQGHARARGEAIQADLDAHHAQLALDGLRRALGVGLSPSASTEHVSKT